MVTDGTVYQRVESMLFWTHKGDAIPYAYIIDPTTGALTFKMEFPGRASPALPYGIAEDPQVRTMATDVNYLESASCGT